MRPAKKFDELMKAVAEKGVTVVFQWGVISDNSLRLSAIGKVSDNRYVLQTNDRVTYASENVKYAILAHEIGHLLEGHCEPTSNNMILNLTRQLGYPDQDVIDREIIADKYSRLISKKGTLKFLGDFLKDPELATSRELKQRLEAVESLK